MKGQTSPPHRAQLARHTRKQAPLKGSSPWNSLEVVKVIISIFLTSAISLAAFLLNYSSRESDTQRAREAAIANISQHLQNVDLVFGEIVSLLAIPGRPDPQRLQEMERKLRQLQVGEVPHVWSATRTLMQSDRERFEKFYAPVLVARANFEHSLKLRAERKPLQAIDTSHRELLDCNRGFLRVLNLIWAKPDATDSELYAEYRDYRGDEQNSLTARMTGGFCPVRELWEKMPELRYELRGLDLSGRKATGPVQTLRP